MLSFLSPVFAWSLLGAPSAAAPPGAAPADIPSPSKKEAYLASKAAEQASRRRRRRSPRRGTRAKQVVFARNLHTLEVMALEGPGLRAPALDRFFRCWFTEEAADLPDELIARVVDTAHTFDVREVHVVSGFRHPKYNLWLRKKGREVATRSQHTRGQAIDFALPGIPVRTLYRHLLDVHGGGVGYYPISAFVHVDLGRKRTWKGS